MDKTKIRIIKDKVFKGIVFLIAIPVAFPLLFIIYYIVSKGISVINWDFFTKMPNMFGDGGGIAHALIGTIVLMIVSSVLALPVGIGTGIFLSENKKSKLAYASQLSVNILQGVPSIVVGIVVYAIVVKYVTGYSALAGGVALGIMMLPVIIKSTEEVLNLIPHTYKEASVSLGVPYYKTILKVIIPTGFGGIISGFLLALARIAGETAPLLFTSFGNAYISTNIMKPISALPLLIYNYATSPYENLYNIGWGASFVLIMLVLLLNIIVRLGRRHEY